MEQILAKRKADLADRRAILGLVLRVAVLAAVLTLVFTLGFLITQVRGQGMFPAVKDGDLCVVFRTPAMCLTGQTLSQDDVIAYTHEGQRYFARVVAVAGDEVELTSSGSVMVNGAAVGGDILFPTYPRGDLTYPLTIPDGCVYALGDYRTHAADSRDHGLIPLDRVDGKVITLLRRRAL